MSGAVVVFGGLVLAVAVAEIARRVWAAQPAERPDPHGMVQHDQWDALQAWLASGGNPDEADPSGFTLLMSAAAHDRPEAARILLAAGAAPDLVEHEDLATALYVAATCGHGEVVRVLLAGGASANRATALGAVPLHAAVHPDRVGLIEDLLASGAHPDFKNAWRLTPLDVAVREGLADAEAALRAGGARRKEEVRMEDVLDALPEADRAAYTLPRAWAIPPDDPRLVAARTQAKADLPTLLAALDAGHEARVQLVLRSAPDRAGESLWAAVVGRDGDQLEVAYLSEPTMVEVSAGPQMHALSDIEDWEATGPDGETVGAYSMRVTLDGVAAEFGKYADGVR
ncbi:MAG: ankyrin repeat domain-containing protein [Myxococcota bacterium]